MTSDAQRRDESFYRNSANRLIHALLYLDSIPKILHNIVPIDFSHVPDYTEKFGQANLEVTPNLSPNKLMLDDEQIEGFPNFSQTEQQLARIWRKVLSLSLEDYTRLNQDSDFFEFTGWCATLPLADLKNQISQNFAAMSVSSSAIEEYTTLGKQAALIDRTLEYREVIDFLSSWIETVFDSRTDMTLKVAKVNQLPDHYRSLLWETLAQSNPTGVVIKDIQPSRLQPLNLIRVAVKATLLMPPKGALAITKPLDLNFLLKLDRNQDPQILSLQTESN